MVESEEEDLKPQGYENKPALRAEAYPLFSIPQDGPTTISLHTHYGNDLQKSP